MLQDLIQSRLGGSYQPHALATLRHNLGFASQKAHFVSEPLQEATRLEWGGRQGPRIVRQARQRKALWLCGDAASLAPWGSRSSPWAPQGEHPAGPTRGKRKGYKVLGLIA
jgi:hypothetical protein